MARAVSRREVTVNESWISPSSLEWLMLKLRSRYWARMADRALLYARWMPARSYRNRWHAL
jgi:hypothetical protein